MHFILHKYKTLLLIVLLCQTIAAQDPTENIIPPSPEMASLGKYLDFPISTYTGQANVSIPIHTLQVGDITLPISLSYHTGGIRVSDISPWTGMGWSLNYGGFINRTIYGVEDGTKATFIPQFPWSGIAADLDFFVEVGFGSKDSQHDMFHFSAGSYSGKFVRDIQGDISNSILIPKQNISIIGQDSGLISTFQVNTPDGLEYEFDEYEITESSTLCSFGGGGGLNSSISGWRPSSITSRATNQQITYTYASERIQYDNPKMYYDILSKGFGFPYDQKTCQSWSRVTNQRRVEEITGTDGTMIRFVPGSDRKDLPGSKMLNRIEVYKDAKLIKSFILTYKYHRDGTFYEIDDNTLESDSEHNRLVLFSIQEQIGQETKPPYVFEYTLSRLPGRFSRSIDYWGYYNGINNNTLVPAMVYAGEFKKGAIRIPVLDKAKQGSLRKITYPTGGYTEYEYELNECSNYSFEYYENPGTFMEYHQLGETDQADTKSFTKANGAPSSNITVSFDEDGVCPNGPFGDCILKFELYKIGSNGTETLLFSSDDYKEEIIYNQGVSITQDLGPGNYELRRTLYQPVNMSSFYISVDWVKNESPDPSIDTKAGGLRIGKTTTYDPSSGQSIVKTITYEEGHINISGLPNFVRSKQHFNYASDGAQCGIGSSLSSATERSSTPNYAMSSTNGGIVGYGKVTVSEGVNAENGRTEYYYTTYSDHPDYIIDEGWEDPSFIPDYDSPGDPVAIPNFGAYTDFTSGDYDFPYPPMDSKDWKRGLLTKQTIIDASGNKLQEMENKYRFFDDPTQNHYDLNKVDFVEGIALSGETMYLCDNAASGNITPIYRYQLASTWYELAEESTTTYTDNGANTVVTKYENYSSQHLMPTTVITDAHDSGPFRQTTIIKEVRYPQDFTGSTFGSDVMRSNHMFIIPLETKTYNDTLYNTGGQNVHYKEFPGGSIQPYKLEKFPTDAQNAITTDLNYDGQGKLLDLYDEYNRSNVSYRWGYSNTLPVIKVQNPSDDLDQYYQSSTVLPSEYSSLESLVLAMDDIATNPAKQELWKTYNENLRNHSGLSQSMITTYTYKPLIGITSVTDPRGYTMYYHYDELNRLEFVKDAEGNLVSENKYNYKN